MVEGFVPPPAWVVMARLSRALQQEAVEAVASSLRLCALADIEFYLPQLSTRVVLDPTAIPLITFLSDCSGASLHFALRLCWLLDAFANSPPLPPVYRDRAGDLRDRMQSASVMGRKSGNVIPGSIGGRFGFQSTPTSPVSPTSPADVRNLVDTRRRRNECFDVVSAFMLRLTNVSAALVRYRAGASRKAALRGEVGRLNTFLASALAARVAHVAAHSSSRTGSVPNLIDDCNAGDGAERDEGLHDVEHMRRSVVGFTTDPSELADGAAEAEAKASREANQDGDGGGGGGDGDERGTLSPLSPLPEGGGLPAEVLARVDGGTSVWGSVPPTRNFGASCDGVDPSRPLKPVRPTRSGDALPSQAVEKAVCGGGDAAETSRVLAQGDPTPPAVGVCATSAAAAIDITASSLPPPPPVYVPLCRSGDPYRMVVEVVDAWPLGSRDRAPFMAVVETCEVGVVDCPAASQGIPQPAGDEEEAEVAAFAKEFQPRPLSPNEVAAGRSSDGGGSRGGGRGADTDGARSALSPTSATGPMSDSVTPFAMYGGVRYVPDRVEKAMSVYGRSWRETENARRAVSRHSHAAGWGLKMFVVKAGDDIRQEELAQQFIATCASVWEEAGVPLRVVPYHILTLSATAGLLECVTDTATIHAVKKHTLEGAPGAPDEALLAMHFDAHPDPHAARVRFTESMAGYAVVSYLLALRDRHNGNVLLRRDGCVVHIDFGFMLLTSPAGNMNFESAHFKLLREHVNVMGGVSSDLFDYFKLLVYLGLSVLRRHSERLVSLVELMLPPPTGAVDGSITFLPCFAADGPRAVAELRAKFLPHLTTEAAVAARVRQMIDESLDSWRTRVYDGIQKWQNDIY